MKDTTQGRVGVESKCLHFLVFAAQVSIRVIDTNNHRPQFSQHKYEITVPEDTPPETEILRISASDGDEKNKMTYTLLSSTDPFSLRKFRLDPGTGLLYTAESLDHETMRRHTLTVMVRKPRASYACSWRSTALWVITQNLTKHTSFNS